MNFQTAVNEVVVEKPVEEPKEVKTEQVFITVEQMPQFPGGDAELMRYLQSHMNYPPMAAENNVQGRVVVQFVVDKTGRVGEVKVVRSVDRDLDKEAVRVCKSLPKFTPGRQNGQAVAVWYTLPVTFKLQGTN
jgi:protein TonB